MAQAQTKDLDFDMDLAVIDIPLESLSEETKATIAIATLGDSASLKLITSDFFQMYKIPVSVT